jgi:hypothetical protein
VQVFGASFGRRFRREEKNQARLAKASRQIDSFLFYLIVLPTDFLFSGCRLTERQQIPPESDCAQRRKNRPPGDEEDPFRVNDECLN